MRTGILWRMTDCVLMGGLLLAGFLAAGSFAQPAWAGPDGPALPRFTEEREAAALHFVKKHLPELLPLLEQLRKDDRPRYELKVREIFQVSELLADLRDEPKRHDLELKVWKAENKAHVLVAQLATPEDARREELKEQLAKLAGELVDLDIQVLEMKIEQLEEEVNKVKGELTTVQNDKATQVKARYEALLDKAKKQKK
jgi:hypothetical protein